MGRRPDPGMEAELLLPHMRLDDLLGELQSRLNQVVAARDRTHTLLEAVVSIGSGLDLETMLHRIVELSADLVDARYGALGVVGEAGELTQFVPVGISEEEIAHIAHWPRGEGLLGLLIKEPHTLRLSELSSHPESHGFPEGHPPMHSFLGVPIRVHGEVFGNLYLTQKTNGFDFDEDDEAVVMALATAAGVAIENARLFEETRRRETWLDASDEVTTRLLSGEDTGTVLELLAHRARVMAEADIAAIAVPSGESELVTEVVDGSHADMVRGRRVPVDGTLSGRAYRGGVPMVVESVDNSSIPTPLLSKTGIGPAAFIPLGVPQQVRGLLLLGRQSGRSRFTPSTVQMLHAFAGHAAVAMELADARRDTERLVVLEDRDRIARDLHDVIIQRLFATAMSLMGTARRITDPQSAERVQRAVDDLDETIRQIRSTIFALQSTADGDQPWLRSQILDIVQGASASLGFAPNLRLDGPIDSRVPDELAENVLAVLQEALSNIARHADASRVDVLVRADDTLNIEVTDNGCGIPTGSRRSGLRNLAHRAQSHNGSFSVDSPKEGGTSLRWHVPLSENSDDE
ncbi:sensor histidine kinase [Allosalinactinospora lopnorensis]|uniref:sensor histidine kinase n=1 Tax=Allosalinactinospora lopnorensis TaxID=1352348 RepID=UPI000623F2EF|nr:GAF domain-containing protein [Allosalinactinospora lopnorensis]